MTCTKPWKARWQDFVVPSALVIACIVFFRHALWGNYFFPWDFVAAMYPVQRLVSDAIRQGEFPLWSPYVLSGYPVVGDPQASLFYPPFLLVYHLPGSAPLSFRTLEWLTVLHIGLAGVGAYWLGRTLGISRLASGLVGLTYMLAGFFPVHVEHETWVLAAAWLPVLFALCIQLLSAPRVWHIPAIALVVAMSFLAGHTQTSLFSLYLIGAYFVWQSWGRHRRGQGGLVGRQGVVLGVAILLGLMLAAVQLLPSWELTHEAFRRYVVFPDNYGVLDIAAPLTMLMPKLFGSDGMGPYLGNEVTHTQKYLGLVPLIFLGVSFIVPLRHPATRFFQAMTLVSLLGSFGTRGLVYHGLKLLPLVTLFRRPAVLFPVALLGMAVLGGWLLDRLIYTKPTPPRWVWGAVVGAALALAVFYTAITLAPSLWSAVLAPLTRIQVVQRVARPDHWPTVQRQGLEMAWLAASVALVLGGMWVWPRARPMFGIAILLVTYADLYQGNAGQIYNASPGDPNELFTATRLEGYDLPDMQAVYAEGLGQARLGIANLGSASLMGSAVLRVESVNGYNPLQLRRLTQYYGSIPSANAHAFDLLNVRYLLTPTDFKDEPTLPSPFWRFGQWWAHEQLYIPPQALDPSKFKQLSVNTNGTLTLWENVAALPRFMAMSRYQVVPGVSERLSLLRDPNFDPSQTLLLEEPFTLPLTGRLAAPVDIVRYTNNRVELAVNVIEGDTLLFISIPYYPGWHATVDGQPTRLLIAQHAFMALHLTPGVHTVQLNFLPDSFVWGVWLTGLGLLALVSSPLWAKFILRSGT